MPSDQDRALHLMLRAVSPGSGDPADDLIARLREVEAARGDPLADDEYIAWRKMVLDQIVRPTPVPLMWRLILAAGCLGALVLAGYGIAAGASSAVVGGGVGSVVTAWLWFGLERDYAMKRRLDRQARFEIIGRLMGDRLVTEAEADELRARMLAAFPKWSE